MSETEILRGAKVRVTTETAQVGNGLTPISQVRNIAFVEADHQIKLAPRILLVAGPIIGTVVYLIANSVPYGAAAGLMLMAVGAMLYRDSWLHQVNARLSDGSSTTLYRTSRKGDALLFHAAVEKALEMRSAQLS
jgi:Family of unknown function (DUF6232)